MTKYVFARAAAAGAVCLSAGCVTMFERSPADRAASVERLQCEDSKSPQDDVQLLQSARVLYVEPKMMYASGQVVAKVTGARIVLRPPDGVTSDRLSRILQCHGARAFLRHTDPAKVPHDPYFLPDAWVSIDVKAEGGNYVAVLEADTITNNLRVLRQANEFAAAQRGATPSGL
jgi:hypothetical protein